MANRADVYVKNDFNTAIQVIRKLEDGTIDLETMIAAYSESQIQLPSPEVSLVIYAPAGIDIKTYPLKTKADVDLNVLSSRTNSTWTLSIVPNDLPPDIPTTTNVTLGQEEPG